MEETGQVIKTHKNFAAVRVDRKSECESCGMCAFNKNTGYIDFNADNSIGAKNGDKVIIETSEKGKLFGALLVFAVPLLLIAAAAAIALFVIKKEIFALILSLAFIAGWFAVLSLIDKKLKSSKSFSTVIIKILNENEKEKENGNKEHNE